MTMENQPFEDVNILLKMVIFELVTLVYGGGNYTHNFRDQHGSWIQCWEFQPFKWRELGNVEITEVSKCHAILPQNGWRFNVECGKPTAHFLEKKPGY